MSWYLKVIRQYADFKGRARRREYWIFALFNSTFLILAMILDNAFGIAVENTGIGPIYGVYALAIFIPFLAVIVRRLHDVGKSGLMLLIGLIPLVGAIWLLVLFVTDSNPKENIYGLNPKDIQSNSVDKDESIGDKLISIVVIWMLISQVFWMIVYKIANNSSEFYSSVTFQTFQNLSNLVWALIPVTLAFAVKKKSMQLALFVIGGILYIYGLYEIIIKLS